MSLVTVPVDGVAEKTYKALKDVADFVAAVQKSLADGWQPGQDLPAILTAAVSELAPALGELGAIVEECKDQKAAIKAVALAVAYGFDKVAL